jgi:excinuclease ABC subunit A
MKQDSAGTTNLSIEQATPLNPNGKSADIFIKGARSNNLQNVDLRIPRNQLVVVTGVSGSGKSSITMDTLYAEGQRRYVESLSSYARQFLMRMKKPEVDSITGLCPAIAVEQKVTTGNARSTVGTMTEIYDFLRLLYARIGKTYTASGQLVKKHEVTDIINFVFEQPIGTKIQLLIPLPIRYADRTLAMQLDLLLKKGYSRLVFQGNLIEIESILAKTSAVSLDIQKPLSFFGGETIQVLIDRFVVKMEDENQKRIADSVQTALEEGDGSCLIHLVGGKMHPFNNRFEVDGIDFLEPTPQLFNYNNPFGACPVCEGYGKTMNIDAAKVIPDPSKSVFEGAVACWNGEKSKMWLHLFLNRAHLYDFPVHQPYEKLTDAQRELLWKGDPGAGSSIDSFFNMLESEPHKIQNRVMIARYRGKVACTSCNGLRLRKEAIAVKIEQKSITELIEMPISMVYHFFKNIKLSEYDISIGKRLIGEIEMRLKFMMDLGLNYLNLSRISSTLSGGETQRIQLTRTLGSNLTSSMYLLDEPSVGLHPRDTGRLISVLKALRDLGNTVIVVEHEEEMIKNADYLVDMGPEAGIHGGKVVFAGAYNKIFTEASESLTTQYMNGTRQIPVPAFRRKAPNWLYLTGAKQHNLKNVSIKIPLGTLTVVTGVSGSGKTTLIKQVLYPALQKQIDLTANVVLGNFESLTGDIQAIKAIEMISQSPIGKSSRSNPVTYVKAYDEIRDLFSKQSLSKVRGYTPAHFSFNVDGGRCESCKGEGEQTVEMQFLADIHLECEDCKGKRFKQEVLEVTYHGKNISDILHLSIEAALDFFSAEKAIVQKIKPLYNVGLGYVQLGQSSNTLSGGEAQRVKLASFLGKEGNREKIFFFFDEPTTGLHFHDIKKLLDSFNALVERGHTVLVIEHNGEVIKSADWVIDLGPEGGNLGGNLVYQGTPEGLITISESLTGQFLRAKLENAYASTNKGGG